MASLIKTTVQNLTRYRNVFTPVIARSMAFRKLEIDPVSSIQEDFIVQHADNKQHSDGQWRLSQSPVIEVSEPIIICDGGNYLFRCSFLCIGCGALGHPMQYLRMNGPNGGVNRCQYCGQTYKYVPKH